MLTLEEESKKEFIFAVKRSWPAYQHIIMQALEEAYRNEVLDPEMEYLMIGPGLDYDNKYEWLLEKFKTWAEVTAE